MFRQVARTTIIAISILTAAPAAAGEWLKLTNFTLIGGSGDPPRAVSELLIREGIIVAIDGQPATVGSGEPDVLTTIDLGGAFVIPGLIDTHVRLANFPRGRDHLADIGQTRDIRLVVANGRLMERVPFWQVRGNTD